VRLAQDPAHRRELAARMRAASERLYGDPAPVAALEALLERVC